MQEASRTPDLMNATQQKQRELNLGKVEHHRDRSSEAFIAERLAESPTGQVRLMESICERQNMNRALKRVRGNKGAPGIDGMTVEAFPAFCREHWQRIRSLLMAGTYHPAPVRRAFIRRDSLRWTPATLAIPRRPKTTPSCCVCSAMCRSTNAPPGFVVCWR